MLHLNSGVHLDEVKLAIGSEEKLDGARVLIVGRPRARQGRLRHALAELGGKGRARRLLHQLLMPSLDGAFAFPQVHHVSPLVPQHLELHVSRICDVLLQVDIGDVEGFLGLIHGGLDGNPQLLFAPCDAHAPAAASSGGFDDDRIADLARQSHRFHLAPEGSPTAGDTRHSGRLHGFPCLGLVPHLADDCRAGADEFDVAGFADLREMSVLRQKTVAGMDGVGVGNFRGGDDTAEV